MSKYEDEIELSKQTQHTVGKQGERVWIFPKKPEGKFHNWRSLVSVLLLTLLFVTPFVKVKGQPLFLFNVLERKFILFGAMFWPQDFYILVFSFLVFIVFVVLFTVVYGRIFCGWICPQTIFMESVFRKIEYLIEGDFLKQKRLTAQDWDFEKIWKKGLKHLIFFSIAVLISHIFWSYIIGWEQVYQVVSEPIEGHWAGFLGLALFSLAFYWVFAWFREQVCIIACPYGRLQGVMQDKNTLTVIYDYLRGEPREKNKKIRESNAGDCVDCHQCVDVCPTGIDIRNGTQLECVNCTACIDACNHVMKLVNKPKGLIRIDSEDGVASKKAFYFNARVKAYTLLLFMLLAILGVLFYNRADIEATVLRGKGQIYHLTKTGDVENFYSFKVINKTMNRYELYPKLISHNGTLTLVGNSKIVLESQTLTEGVMYIIISPDKLKHMKNEIEIGFYDSKNQLITKTESKFLAP